MKALVFEEAGIARLRDVAEPQPETDEELLQVAAAGICGSDLHGVRHPGFRTPPLILGHEIVGRDHDGRLVAVNPLLTCGTCEFCKTGRDELCLSRELLGAHRSGGLAEEVAVPKGNLHRLSDAVDLPQAAMVEPLANALHSWRRAGVPEGQTVGIIGGGTVGMTIGLVAERFGHQVQVAEVAKERRMVAARVLDGMVASELSGSHEVVFDAVGSADTRRDSVAKASRGGRAVWVGLAEDESPLSGHPVVREQKEIVGSFAYSSKDFAAATELCGQLDFGWVDVLPFNRADQVFSSLLEGDASITKAVLVSSSSAE